MVERVASPTSCACRRLVPSSQTQPLPPQCVNRSKSSSRTARLQAATFVTLDTQNPRSRHDHCGKTGEGRQTPLPTLHAATRNPPADPPFAETSTTLFLTIPIDQAFTPQHNAHMTLHKPLPTMSPRMHCLLRTLVECAHTNPPTSTIALNPLPRPQTPSKLRRWRGISHLAAWEDLGGGEPRNGPSCPCSCWPPKILLDSLQGAKHPLRPPSPQDSGISILVAKST
jgi:hypothetical protein